MESADSTIIVKPRASKITLRARSAGPFILVGPGSGLTYLFTHGAQLRLDERDIPFLENILRVQELERVATTKNYD